MLHRHSKKSAAFAAACSIIVFGSPVFAANDGISLHIEGIKGESGITGSDAEKSDNWIEVLWLKSVEHRATGQATGKRAHKPFVSRDPYTPAQPEPAATDKIAPADEQDEIAVLLLPAVQKVREAAMRMPAWEGCEVGRPLRNVRIKQNSSGRTGRILDATVATCATDQFSLNFTQIKWD